jgi:hypothetical protein
MYTTHGLMDAGDYAEHLTDHDLGTTDVQLDDPPEWFVGTPTGHCPVCGDPINDHDTVTVQDASGEIIACLPDGGEWHTLRENDHPIY